MSVSLCSVYSPEPAIWRRAVRNDQSIDELDSRLILELLDDPRIGVMELARRLGVARGTANARLNRLLDSGVVKLELSLDLEAVGYPIAGFATLAISQGSIREVAESLAEIPEVLEAHTVTGDGDVLVLLAARSTDHLFYIIEQALQSPAVQRTSTSISLVRHVPRRIGPLVSKLGDTARETDG